jgi:hypothetical protein
MARGHFPLYALNQGEVSKQALSRVDQARLRLAADCQLNWVPWTVGAMSLRTGLDHVGETSGDNPTKLVRFVFSKLDTALIELTPNTMRIWVDDGLVTRVAVGTTVQDPTFSGSGSWTTGNTTSGCLVSQTGVAQLLATAVGGLAQIAQSIPVSPVDYGKEHGLRIVVGAGPVTVRAGTTAGQDDYIARTVLDTGTHSIAVTPQSNINIQIESTDQYTKALASVTCDVAGVLTLPHNFGADDLANIRYDQSGDILYVSCKGKQQIKIERRSTTSWSVVTYKSTNGPTSAASNASDVQLTPGATMGNTTLIANRPFFKPGHVGSLVRLFSFGGHCDTVIGGGNSWCPPFRVTGVGLMRNFTWNATLSGFGGGIVSLQRSLEGPDSGFVTVATTNITALLIPENTGTTAGVPDLDNAIAWYRIGCESSGYISGTATVSSSYNGGGRWGVARITSYTSATVVNVQIEEPFSSTGSSSLWELGDWSDAAGSWPTSVCFHEGRLWWFGQRIWGSQSDNFTGFATQDAFGNALGDAAAIIQEFGSGPVDVVSWGLSLLRLLMGREQSIACARSSSFDEPMTPTAFSVKDCTSHGADRLPAVKFGQRGIYVQQSHRRVFELRYEPQGFDYGAHDLTRLNLDVGKAGFVAIDMQQQPDPMARLVRGDGQLANLLINPEDEVEAWTRAQTLGVIEDVCVLPSDGLEDIVYVTVKRTVNGVTKRFVEKFALRDQAVGGTLNHQLDCALTYSGVAASTMTLAHLPNTTVSVWADGLSIGSATTDGAGVLTFPDGLTHTNAVAGLAGSVITQEFATAQGTLTVGTAYNGYPCEVFADIGSTGRPVRIGPLVVAGGVVTLPNNQVATIITACLGYVAPFMSSKLAYGAQRGSPLTAKKRIEGVGLVLYDAAAQSLKFGQRFDHMDDLPLVEAGAEVAEGTIWSEFEGPIVVLPGEWNTDARLCLLAQAPNPVTVGAVVIAMDTNG